MGLNRYTQYNIIFVIILSAEVITLNVSMQSVIMPTVIRQNVIKVTVSLLGVINAKLHFCQNSLANYYYA